MLDPQFDLTSEELECFDDLDEAEKQAYMLVRDTSQCAAQRLAAGRLLPNEALRLIGNVCAMTVLRARG